MKTGIFYLVEPRHKKTREVRIFETDYGLLEVFMKEERSDRTEDGFHYGVKFIDRILRENKELREQVGLKPQSFSQSYVM